MPKLTFQWNAPFAIDPDEPECRVEFWYQPGNGKNPQFPGDPDSSPSAVEEVVVFTSDGGMDLEEMDRRWADEVRTQCWAEAEEWARGQVDDREGEE